MTRAGSIARGIGRLIALALLLAAAPLRAQPAMEYLSYEVQVEQALAGICLTFTGDVPRRPSALEPFVEVSPRTDTGLTGNGRRVCLSGLRHGQEYRVTLHAGLPAADGGKLAQETVLAVTVPDRAPRLFFSGNGTILPFRNGGGLPLRSVNAAEAKLRVYRIGERNIIAQIENSNLGEALTGWSESQIAGSSGQKVFDGSVEIRSERNREVTTALPLDQMLPELRPGLYVAVAGLPAADTQEWEARATQWFTVSDLGLLAIKGTGGLDVVVSSIASAEPVQGAMIELVSRSNDRLATLTTDGAGRAMLPAAMLRGAGGAAPRLLLASRGTGELSFLELDKPALDLVDLGVDGRTPPGPLDAFLWTERGIYRPGETIHLGMLLRDPAARAVPDLPITLKLLRPDTIEAARFTLPGGAMGAGTLDIPVPQDAFTGAWAITAHAGADRPAIGRVELVVEDFVPPRLEIAATAVDQRPPASGPIKVGVEARYLYGAAAAGLTGEVELFIRAASEPFPAFKGWRFGLVQEPFLQQGVSPMPFTADDKGRATLQISPESLPETTFPLEAQVLARVFDIDGRPTATDLVIPLSTSPAFIGIRPGFDDAVPEGGEARFEIARVNADGDAQGQAALAWALYEEEWDYVWFQRYGRWEYENTVRDRRVGGGELALGADGRAVLAQTVTSGRYRIEVFDPNGITATSVRFNAGWWSDGVASDRPDKLPVTLLPDSDPGTVRARIETAFPARVIVALADGAVRQLKEVMLPKGGGIVEFSDAEVGPGGAYLLATAISPSGAVLPRLPARAVGAAWIAGPLAERRLDLAIEAPESIEPGRQLPVTIRVANAQAGEEVQVTLAMVDDAVLQMTRYTAPDAAGHYLGRRALGIELRDVYGRLIDPAGQPGRLVSGGDSRASLQLQGIDVKTFQTVAAMTAPLTVGADGTAQASFAVPDFSGRLRLMAVAWSKSRVGNAEATLTVRPPLLAELTLPRFLAPGDVADLRFRLTALSAPPGTYEVALTTEGGLSFDRTKLSFKDVMPERGRFAPLKLTAGTDPGTRRIGVRVTGPNGHVTERSFEIAIRAPQPYLTRRELLTLAPGQRLTLDGALAADLLPRTARGELTVSSVPAFDVPGLVGDLERYPYGCTEQTVSRALPLLYLAKLLGPEAGRERAEAAQRAIGRLASLEATSGGFAVWSARGEAEYWLTAYVADFLAEARANGVSVPGGMEQRTLDWLARQLSGSADAPAQVAAGSYAGLVLARAGRIDTARLRYFALRTIDRQPSDASRVQLAAALAHQGERELSGRLMAGLGQARLDDPKAPLMDYGTSLRDEALVLATASAVGLRTTSELLPLADRTARDAAGTRWLGTQEQAWLLRAAASLSGGGDLDLLVGGDALSGRQTVQRPFELANGTPPLELQNRAQEPAYVAVGVTGVPATAPPAESRGFTIERRWFKPDGQPANVARLRQSEQLVAVIEGKVTAPGFRRALVVDLLPAGLELESLELVGSPSLEQFAWLGELAQPQHIALRDDRFVASLDLQGGQDRFRLAYIARAVTAGSFAAPGIQVEDMVEPSQLGRGPAGRLNIAVR